MLSALTIVPQFGQRFLAIVVAGIGVAGPVGVDGGDVGRMNSIGGLSARGWTGVDVGGGCGRGGGWDTLGVWT